MCSTANGPGWACSRSVASVPATAATARNTSAASQARAVAHHAAVGHAGGEHAAGVHAVALAQRLDDLAQEAHVVDALVARIAAAAAGVPGGELAARQLAVAVGEGDDEARLVGLALQAVVLGHVLGVAAAAVQGQHQRRGLCGIVRPAGRWTSTLRPCTCSSCRPLCSGRVGGLVGAALFEAGLEAVAQRVLRLRRRQQQRGGEGQQAQGAPHGQTPPPSTR